MVAGDGNAHAPGPVEVHVDRFALAAAYDGDSVGMDLAGVVWLGH
jgi:hypothetical protein